MIFKLETLEMTDLHFLLTPCMCVTLCCESLVFDFARGSSYKLLVLCCFSCENLPHSQEEQRKNGPHGSSPLARAFFSVYSFFRFLFSPLFTLLSLLTSKYSDTWTQGNKGQNLAIDS